MDNYKKDKGYIKQRLEYVSPIDYISKLEEQIENLQNENEELKFWLNDVIFDDNNNVVELPARYLKKLGYIDFDDEKQVYTNKHNNEPFLQKEYKEKVFNLKDDELDDYTKQLEYKFKKVIEYCDNNMEFTPRLIDVKKILQGGDE